MGMRREKMGDRLHIRLKFSDHPKNDFLFFSFLLQSFGTKTNQMGKNFYGTMHISFAFFLCFVFTRSEGWEIQKDLIGKELG
jgi:hypothetical protein